MKAGWKTEPLGELCEFQRGLTYAKSDEVDVSDNVVLRATNINLTTNLLNLAELKYINDKVAVPDSKKVKKDSLMICTASGSKSHLGKVAYIDDDYGYAFGGFMGMITPKNGLVPKYLFHLMTSSAYKDFIGDLSDGANINNLKFDDLKQFQVPHPSPDEQKRIVGLLDEAFTGIAAAKANAEKNLQNARALFESHLQTVFSRRPDEVSLAELATDVTDGDHSPPPKAPSGVPFITISDIVKRTREVDFSNTFTVPAEYFRNLKPNKKPRVGDILYTVTGATLGIPVLVREQRDFCFQRHIGLIRPKPETDSAWLTYALLSPQVFRQATIGSTGAAQKTVSLSVLRGLKVPKLPLTEQRQTAARLDALTAETQRLDNIYEHKLAALEALKKSLLHQAFNGNL